MPLVCACPEPSRCASTHKHQSFCSLCLIFASLIYSCDRAASFALSVALKTAAVNAGHMQNMDGGGGCTAGVAPSVHEFVSSPSFHSFLSDTMQGESVEELDAVVDLLLADE